MHARLLQPCRSVLPRSTRTAGCPSTLPVALKIRYPLMPLHAHTHTHTNASVSPDHCSPSGTVRCSSARAGCSAQHTHTLWPLHTCHAPNNHALPCSCQSLHERVNDGRRANLQHSRGGGSCGRRSGGTATAGSSVGTTPTTCCRCRTICVRRLRRCRLRQRRRHLRRLLCRRRRRRRGCRGRLRRAQSLSHQLRRLFMVRCRRHLPPLPPRPSVAHPVWACLPCATVRRSRWLRDVRVIRSHVYTPPRCSGHRSGGEVPRSTAVRHADARGAPRAPDPRGAVVRCGEGTSTGRSCAAWPWSLAPCAACPRWSPLGRERRCVALE
jgi:hypothetical protein